MQVKITWTGVNGKLAAHSLGSIGLPYSAFTLDTIKGGAAYRLKNLLPGFSSWEEEFFFVDTPEASGIQQAQDQANELAAAFFQNVARVATGHPGIRDIEYASQFTYPAQLCHEDCPFYGGTGVHEDVVMEKAPGGWTIARPDGRLLAAPSQEWETPTATLDQPEAARFLWEQEEAHLQVHFLHCG